MAGRPDGAAGACADVRVLSQRIAAAPAGARRRARDAVRPLPRNDGATGRRSLRHRLRTHPAPLRKKSAQRDWLWRHLRRRRRQRCAGPGAGAIRISAGTRCVACERSAGLPGIRPDADRPGRRPLRATRDAGRGQGADAHTDQPYAGGEAALYSPAVTRTHRTDTMSIFLGVNIDHIATLRLARKTRYPSPVEAALAAETAGADSITLHLREDRRHIQDADVAILRQVLKTKMNLEMAVTEEMLAIAIATRPQDVCLVPEKREELTTEGGLDVAGQLPRLKDACKRLADAGIRVSLFIDADVAQLDAAHAAGAPVVEIHTGHYADAATDAARIAEFERIRMAVAYGRSLGLTVNAGHGLTYHNVQSIAALPGIHELNIGHAIVAQALFVGWKEAVAEMKQLMVEAAR